MAKDVAVITAFSYVAELHRLTLTRLFGDAIRLKCYSYEEGNLNGPIDADVVIVSIYHIYLNVRQFIPARAKTVIISNTITDEQYQQVAELPAGRSVLLVNYSVEMTMETMTLFHQLGLNHLEFVPFYPGIARVPRLEVAVTTGERRLVPAFVKRVIDIGGRVMDAPTIIDITTSLGLEHLLREERFIHYFKNLRMNPDRVTTLFSRTNILEGQIAGLLDVLDDGILIIESTGLIHAGNRKAHEVLGTDMNFVGVRVSDLVPGIPFARVLNNGAEVDRTLVKINGRNVSVKVVPMIIKGETRGALATLNTFEEMEKSQQRLRSQLLGKGHRSRYTFDDILTRSPAFLQTKLLARKKADSDASVLIIGETGTGKELIAHAIHHASRRNGRQFVPINCAALPESLLESELFGYEEGAFTGARKGGKPGLFELAHKGTIFLDEIGEMNLSLQGRLLRVLESREVMRIGGDSLINVDIRVIAATNKALWQLVQDGGFRKDLYYRLNVLPIEVPPLRERKEDILFILERILERMGVGVTLTQKAADVLTSYPWYGNVRELKNLAEYLAYLDKQVIEEKDIMPVLKWPTPARGAGDARAACVPASTDPGQDHRRFILECLDANYRRRVRSGRRSLHQNALERGLFLSEAQIRKLLVQLEQSGYVQLSSGRGGTLITQAGIEALRQMGMS